MRVSTLSVAALAFGIAQAGLPAGKPATSSETEICYDDEPTSTYKHSSVKPTGKPSYSPRPPKLTTSTILSTKTYTVSKCPESVKNCPGATVTTEIITVGTTVCPVTDDEPEWTTVPKPTYTHPGKPDYSGKPDHPGKPDYPDHPGKPDYPKETEGTKPAGPVVTDKPVYVPTGTGSLPAKSTSANYPVTAGAGRVAQGVSAVAVVAGLVAYLL